MFVDFHHWTQGRSVASLGTNAGSVAIPFQRWRHFKEAFAPEVVSQAVAGSRQSVRTCLDPFGGSGTTALACQFLGVRPTTVEVNPFLADLIEAKLASYDCNLLVTDLTRVLRQASDLNAKAQKFIEGLPSTFVEPGVNGRWVFDRPVAIRLAETLLAINELAGERERRLYRVLLGGVMLGLSNVVVNGKGRRYRRGWDPIKSQSAADVDRAFTDAATAAIGEIDRFARRRELDYQIIRGDSRYALDGLNNIDLSIFSPPYPNSFDYTDVYNVELWMLGYLRNKEDNRRLRGETLASHVQIHREFAAMPPGSALLESTIDALTSKRNTLWSSNIPDMIGGYFADMAQVMKQLTVALSSKGEVWMVVGDSRYAGIKIPVAQILADLAPANGWEVDKLDILRDMRTSAQQGGRHELAESLLVLRKS